MKAIEEVSAKVIQDSRGKPTIEATVGLEGGLAGTASVPSGKSVGMHEANTVEPSSGVTFIETDIRRYLEGKVFESQSEFDSSLISFDSTPQKTRYGANTLLALSVAYARASAREMSVPLFAYIEQALGGETERGDLRLYANIVNGGLHAKTNLRFQEHIAIPKFDTFFNQVAEVGNFYDLVGKKIREQYKEAEVQIGDEGGYALNWPSEDKPFELMTAVKGELGLHDMSFGLDAAASNINQVNNDKLQDIYKDWVNRFGLSYIEDPFGEEDFGNFKKLKEALPGVLVTGDDLTTTNIVLIEKARQSDSINSVIIKPNQIGTLSEALESVRAARKNGWKVVVSHRSGETMDDWISDFAVGSGADGFKLGAPSKPERLAKYNRLLGIEKEMLG